MERPRFLTGENVGRTLAVIGLWLSTACISAVNPEAKPTSSPQPPVPTATPARFWGGSRLPLVSEGQFTTNKGPTYWSNFTTTPFNPKSAESMLQTFEYFAQRRFLAIPIFDAQDLQRNEIVSVQTWPEPPTDLLLNLIPDKAPLPEWAKQMSLWGVRSLGMGRLEAFVRITGQDSDNLSLGRVFCQSRLNIEVSSPRVLIFTSDQLGILLREPVCNGYNFAVDARRKNTPYERYKRITEETLIVIPPTLAYRLPVLLEQNYQAIPQQTGAIGSRFSKPPTVAQRYFFWG